MDKPSCRACRNQSGHLVFDLGEQPACDYFPSLDDPGPDPVYPLQMWLCGHCGLAQLADDPTVPEEPRGAEPAALVAQAADAVRQVGAAGLLPEGATVAEYGSPHGGSWLDALTKRGLRPVADSEQADVVVDCFGLMHAADQRSALAGRIARVSKGGTLLLQYHSLDTIIRRGQWNALRHGHYAYYSTTALVGMLAAHGFSPRSAWHFELYGGTVLMAAAREAVANASPDGLVGSLLAQEASTGVADPAVLRRLQGECTIRSSAVRAWLSAEQSAGRIVLGYGAASRAVALLCLAGVTRACLPAVVDASPAKQGRRMPGTDIPVVSPARLAANPPDAVLLFITDMLGEVRQSVPEVESAGGCWVTADSLV